ncbi:MAG: DUF1080 domain-containing protein [Opitutaceae bacterium]|nr:DUF1080 domain-containing protein [Opitutaceae bacterium]
MIRPFPVVVAFLALGFSLPAADPVRVFNGSDLAGWTTKPGAGKNLWVVGLPSVPRGGPRQLNLAPGTGVMVNTTDRHGQGLNLVSPASFGDCFIDLEVMLPAGSNSGIYVMGEYELQVFDSFGKPDAKLSAIDMGAIYGASLPRANACKAPGEWQRFTIEWRAPRFDAAGGKTANACFVRVTLNGVVLHENVEMPKPTPQGLTGKEHPRGPLMLQGDHGPVAYRNILITPR